jgi:hypothetical protein
VLLSGEENLSSTVKITGDQTINGIKTFSQNTNINSINFTKNIIPNLGGFNKFTIQNRPFTGTNNNLYTGWNISPNNSDSASGIKLNSGSFIEITYSGISNETYGLLWYGLSGKPDTFGTANQKSFPLFSGTTLYNQLDISGGPIKISGYLPRDSNYLILRPIFDTIDAPFPSIAVSGNSGIDRNVIVDAYNDKLFIGNSEIITSDKYQLIDGLKNFTTQPTFSGMPLITTGDLAALEFNIVGVIADTSKYINLTHLQLKTLQEENLLVSGQYYRISDFRLKWHNQSVNDTGVKSGIMFEPLVVQALSRNKISHIAKSEMYPQDTIYYDFDATGSYSWGTINNNAAIPDFKGWIYRRIDNKLNIDVAWDWRQITVNCLPLDISSISSWSSSTNYSYLDVVKQSTSDLFASLRDNNSGINPSNNNLDWLRVPPSLLLTHFIPTNEVTGYQITFSDDVETSSIYIPFDTNSRAQFPTFIENNTENPPALSLTHVKNLKILGGHNSYFVNNVELPCENNTVGTNFNFNLINASFIDNNIANNFSGNTIYDNFKQNKIDNSFTENRIGGIFTNNEISSGFSQNIIGKSGSESIFENNRILNNFKKNKVLSLFDNTIDNNVTLRQLITGINIYGKNNTVSSTATNSFVNGSSNRISGSAQNSFISNGFANLIIRPPQQAGTVSNSYINNGRENVISGAAFASFISNGCRNLLCDSISSHIANGCCNLMVSERSAIQHGFCNSITGSSEDSTILGGSLNSINRSVSVLIGNGVQNSMGVDQTGVEDTLKRTNYSSIVNGSNNRVIGDFNLIGGGSFNKITGDYNREPSCIQSFSRSNVIAGGSNNTIDTASCSAILGGRYNEVIHNGATVIGDGSLNIKTSKGACTLLLSFSNGIYLESPLIKFNGLSLIPSTLPIDIVPYVRMPFGIRGTSAPGTSPLISGMASIVPFYIGETIYNHKAVSNRISGAENYGPWTIRVALYDINNGISSPQFIESSDVEIIQTSPAYLQQGVVNFTQNGLSLIPGWYAYVSWFVSGNEELRNNTNFSWSNRAFIGGNTGIPEGSSTLLEIPTAPFETFYLITGLTGAFYETGSPTGIGTVMTLTAGNARSLPWFFPYY